MHVVFVDKVFLGTPVNLRLSFPKVPVCTFFPNLSKFLTFAAAPLVLTPFVRKTKAQPPPSNVERRAKAREEAREAVEQRAAKAAEAANFFEVLHPLLEPAPLCASLSGSVWQRLR